MTKPGSIQALFDPTDIQLVPGKPGHWLPLRELQFSTSMGRFTAYPGDEIDDSDPDSMIIRRGGRDLRIARVIISGAHICS